MGETSQPKPLDQTKPLAPKQEVMTQSSDEVRGSNSEVTEANNLFSFIGDQSFRFR
jgi:hypothetical protein